MPENNADTTVDEVVDDQGQADSSNSSSNTATPATETEVSQEDDSRYKKLEQELSRIRAAQSAADKRASDAERRAKELEEQTKRASYGEDETAYYKSLAIEKAREAEELKLKHEVNNLLEEHNNLPSVLREAIRKNPLGFIGDASDVPTAVYRISSYLSELEAKNQPQEDNEPKGKTFKVPEHSPRTNTPTVKPKSLEEAIGKLVDSGLFN